MRVKTCVVCIAFTIILLRVHPTGSGTFRSIQYSSNWLTKRHSQCSNVLFVRDVTGVRT